MKYFCNRLGTFRNSFDLLLSGEKNQNVMAILKIK